MESVNSGAPTPVKGETSYTEVLPSLNLTFLLDEAQEHQLRFSLARAMARAPLDEMRGSRNLSDVNPGQPLTGSAGNPELKPMLAGQVDLALQWYFAKGSLLSARQLYKDVSRYIGITGEQTTINGPGHDHALSQWTRRQRARPGTGLPARFYPSSCAMGWAGTVEQLRLHGQQHPRESAGR
jgi:outer membrane receptor protein involved in Fe transport